MQIQNIPPSVPVLCKSFWQNFFSKKQGLVSLTPLLLSLLLPPPLFCFCNCSNGGILAPPSTCFLLLFFFFASYSLLPSEASVNQDLEALLAFKAASDTHNKLTSWNSTTHPCTWAFVSCLKNRVSRLVLENLDLHGSIEPLTSLTQLRVLSLKRNRLSGPIPSLSNFTALKLLFLSHNEFSGVFPVTVTSLLRLYRLDLSHNNLTGNIPTTVNNLTHLLSLRLNDNQFSGHIPTLNLSNLQDFNVSGNRFSGEIPKPVSGFPESSFAQNPSLCGAPLVKCKDSYAVPIKPGSVGANNASPLMPRSNPSTSTPANNAAPGTSPNNSHHHNGASKMSPILLIAIIVGDILVLAVVSLLLYCCFWQNYSTKLKEKNMSKLLESEKILYSSSPYPSSQPGFERGQMVFFEGMKKFELEDLLRASAEMLGKGGFGTAYKAVLDDGNVVAVKRLKDAQINGKKEFEQHMEVLGRLRHPNIVSLRAYYYARDERLLVYDYMTNGSLFWLLHGNRGPGRTPLDWTTRLKMAAGVGRGLAFIHGSCKALKLTHGNIKSTNILIDQDGNARVADFGLSVFATPATSASAAKSNGYRAPEALDGRKNTQKSDVYSFGVLLLELLTGKWPSVGDAGGPGGGGAVDLPRWVQSVVREEWTAEVFDIELMRYKDIEEEMVGLLQIAMSCCAAAPDQRPRMSHVVRMIEDIRGVEMSPGHHDASDSVSESPSLSEDAGGASQ
ncbi:probable leucine-rich repeat receptor-like protein kinase At1g68400 [Prosopis cineraria]|uniref:probable leucine-rich repeat receptor-like protein kinase At1g68400 n=1 Tax=Prosopis cineraria TaxID=364024 RepID=UPI00240F287E|nr:probable leucine-rich repeat receptor-like protein kinase At1g68400 [Prosopis cineraria]